MTYKEIQEDVIKKYHVIVKSKSGCWGRMHAHVKERTVCKWSPKNSVQATFDLLHEVGHIETTTSGMRRYEAELYATQWALDRCREYGIMIPRKTYEAYKDYIQRTLDRGVRRGGSDYPKMDLAMDVVKG